MQHLDAIEPEKMPKVMLYYWPRIRDIGK